MINLNLTDKLIYLMNRISAWFLRDIIIMKSYHLKSNMFDSNL